MNKAVLNSKYRLLEAAVSLMWTRGYHATSVDALCRQAHVTKGSFYYFFSSKSELAIATIQWSWENTKRNVFDPLFKTNDGGLTLLQQMIDKELGTQTALMHSTGHFLGCPFGGLGQEMAGQDERIREAIQSVFLAHCSYIEQALSRAVDLHEIQPGNMKQKARLIFALMEGAMLLAKVAKQPDLLQEITPMILLIAQQHAMPAALHGPRN